MWNDERDLERLLILKAVLTVGEITIMLYFVQILVRVAQVMASIVTRNLPLMPYICLLSEASAKE
jgi:hypothetical protein